MIKLTTDRALEITRGWTAPYGSEGSVRSAELVGLQLAQAVDELREALKDRDECVRSLRTDLELERNLVENLRPMEARALAAERRFEDKETCEDYRIVCADCRMAVCRHTRERLRGKQIEIDALFESVKNLSEYRGEPIPMVLYCPVGHLHLDEGDWASRPHRTHQCQYIVRSAEFHVAEKRCGLEWRPASVPTVGVRALAEEAK